MNLICDIIWDFDGTLFDTYPELVNAFRNALKDSGIDETAENILKLMKISEGHAIEKMKEQYGLKDDFVKSYQSYKCKIKPEMSRPFPYAEEVLGKLTESGGRNYILTHRGGIGQQISGTL